MLENFIYENHLGERFVGLENGVYLNHNDLRDYSWDYDTINSKISRFYRPITDKKLPLVILCGTGDKANQVKNKLLDLAESDIVARIPGRIYVGDFYITGYITKSAKSNYLINKRLTNIDLTFTTDDPAWYREKTYHVDESATVNAEEMMTAGGTDYNVGYDHDFAAPLSENHIYVDTSGEALFKIRIYGRAEYPTIMIGGNPYSINGVIADGETLLIDGLERKITLTSATGVEINWFYRRGRESDIFKPIKPGAVEVTRNGTFAFDLTVIEKRSEPRWT
jgi:hypothetical protein